VLHKVAESANLIHFKRFIRRLRGDVVNIGVDTAVQLATTATLPASLRLLIDNLRLPTQQPIRQGHGQVTFAQTAGTDEQ
jgi:hypothetical protein